MGVGFGNIWNVVDTLNVSLGKRNKDLRRSLRACSLLACPILTVSIPVLLCLLVSSLCLLGTVARVSTEEVQGMYEHLERFG